MPEFLNGALKFGLLPREVVYSFRDVHKICDALLLLLGFNLRHICHRGALCITRNVSCRREHFVSFDKSRTDFVGSLCVSGSAWLFQPSLGADTVHSTQNTFALGHAATALILGSQSIPTHRLEAIAVMFEHICELVVQLLIVLDDLVNKAIFFVPVVTVWLHGELRKWCFERIYAMPAFKTHTVRAAWWLVGSHVVVMRFLIR